MALVTWTELSNSSSHIQQGDIGKDTILMQVNCPDGHQAASGKATFEARPAISRENANPIAYLLFPDWEDISQDWRSSDT